MSKARSISSVTSEILALDKRVCKGEATPEDKARIWRLRESQQAYRHNVNCTLAALQSTNNPEVRIALAKSLLDSTAREAQAPVLMKEAHPFWVRVHRSVYTSLIRPLSQFMCALGLKLASLNPQE